MMTLNEDGNEKIRNCNFGIPSSYTLYSYPFFLFSQ